MTDSSPHPSEYLDNLPATASPLPAAPGASLETPSDTSPPELGVSKRWITLFTLAQFGLFMAFITPMAISLAFQVKALAPNNEEYLGYITGSASAVVMVITPILGILSDHTRSRLGRRRPWMIGGVILGVISLVVMGTAPSILVLGAGWIMAQLGWGQALANLGYTMADRLSESQRGKVAGLVGFATQVAPVGGVIIASSFSSNSLLLFLVPGIAGVVFVGLFIVFSREQDSRTMYLGEKLTVAGAFKKYLFNPKRYPDYSLVWLGRFLFYVGLTFNTTFTAFFFSARLGIQLDEVAPLMAGLSLVGIVAITAGAIGGGFLSDKLKRRRMFVLIASLIFTSGVVVQAFAGDFVVLAVGSLMASMGIGMFSAVDQALLLDVLPERETDAGRFMGIAGFATSIPQSLAPLIAPAILVIGASGDEKNYGLLYIIAGIATFLGGLVVMRVRSVR